MKLEIAGFTHVGTKRIENQDRILIGKEVLGQGEYGPEISDNCACFVADGVGGNRGGEIAAQFVLDKIASFDNIQVDTHNIVNSFLADINVQLRKKGNSDTQLSGMATTLVGLILNSDQTILLWAGDSEGWLFRHTHLAKLTTDHVLDPFIPNSPITSYFGGFEERLSLEISTGFDYVLEGDLIMICSDGLLKSLKSSYINNVFKEDISLKEKLLLLKEKSLANGAPDNLSCILISVLEE